jgi:hypothetical protein
MTDAIGRAADQPSRPAFGGGPADVTPSDHTTGVASRVKPIGGEANLGRPGFVDRLLKRIASLPLGGWWVYALLFVGVGTWATVVRWATGAAPVGSVDLTTVTWAFYLPYYLAMIHYLDRSAERALAAFAPALGGSPDDLASWRRELTSMPPRQAAVATLVGAAFGALLVAGTPPSIYLLFSPSLVATALLTGWLIVLSFAVFAVLLYHTWHQLKAVRAIHAAAEHIDPFRPAPLFAFSRLTARTGIGFLLYLVYGLVVNGDFTRAAAPAVVDYLVSITPAVACFLIPLMGMQRRLTAAKSQLLAESDARIQAATAELYRRVDSGQLADSGDVRDALEGLTIVRDLTARLSTWPWSPQLLGGFVTALILPIVIWFITRALGSVLSV